MRVRMTVAYDGSAFHGFAANRGVRTVAGDLVAALERVLRVAGPLEMACAGRTDKGVHAIGQVVSFDAPAEAAGQLDDLCHRVNRLCAPAIAVRDAMVVPSEFDARHSAKYRRYRYLILNRAAPDPFLAGRAWHIPEALDLAALTLACDPLVGEHDFASFCRRPRLRDGTEASLRRRVTEAQWSSGAEGMLQFEIEASAFCHQMVRSIVGTLVDIGRGKRRAGEMLGILRAADRAAAGDLAPPDGLYLLRVGY